MGSYTKFGTGSQGDTYTFSASQDGNNVDLLLNAGSGADSTVQLTAGTNITLTRNSASEVTIDAAGGSGGAAESALKILLTVKNVSGGTLSAGTLVRVAPTANPPSGNVLEVDVADNSTASTMPAVGILIASIADEAEGDAVAFGRASGFSTSGYTEGDPIWVGSNGAFVGTKPTGTAFIQKVGQIIKVHASNGSIEVFGAGRSNDVPNIPQDQLWLGNSSGVATPTAHTVENISNVTVSSKQNGQALVWDAANNYWKNGTVSGGGGGGGTELSIERNVFTATANQTAFTISSAITASSNTQVYIDGVYQAKSNYTTSGSTITFSTGVPAGSEVEVIHFISVLSKVYTDTFTGNGTTVNFTASKDVTDENVTQIYIDGVYQSKDNYTTSGTTITFSTAPPSGSAIEVVHFTPAVYSTLNSNQFTGTGSQTDFTLTQAVDVDKSFVFIQGVYQEKSTYSISGTTLAFTTAPLSGYTIEVITVGAVSVFNDTLFLDNFTGNGTLTDYTLSTTPASENAIDVYLNGIYQNKDTFTLSGNTLTFSTAPTSGTAIEIKSTGGLNNVVTSSGGGISWQTTPKTAAFTATAGEGYFVNTTSGGVTVTLPSSPTAGDEVSIVDYAGTADTNNITITSSNNINGSSNDVKIDYERGGVSMVYVDATQGWIAYNANNETADSLIDSPVIVSVDYLVVAGGGGGGASISGGGGAGGLRTSYGNTQGGGQSSESSLSIAGGANYTVTVGAGGAGGTDSGTGGVANGSNGGNSVFSTVTSIGGGTSEEYEGDGIDGGSGGGSPRRAGSTYGDAVTSPVVHGYRGGSGSTTGGQDNYGSGAGGGGAGSVGGNASGSTGGAGGSGLEVNIIGGTGNYYAGGGGGGAFNGTGGSGTDGGGNGSGGTVAATDGSPNVGAGGGAGGYPTTRSAGDGGSGIVILRYPSGYTIAIGSGLTGSTTTDGSDKVTTFTAGTGNISFS